MTFDIEDTIAAVASANGSAIRGVIRISGPSTIDLLEQLRTDGIIASDVAGLRELLFAQTIDADFVVSPQCKISTQILIWPDRRSFTRQPSAEVHTIGCGPILEKILEIFFARGVRPAEPGEFTMRAFLSGRINLTQAEAVLGLIDSRNERQFHASLNQLSGGIGSEITKVKDQLINLLAELEAGLDFVDEDIEFVSRNDIVVSLEAVSQMLISTRAQYLERKSGSNLPQVVLAGQPNAGKSSLFNELTGKEAIISNVAGTTRDYLQANIEFNGTKFILVDTAGIEEHDNIDSSQGPIGSQMYQFARSKMDEADVIVLCVDSQKQMENFENKILENGKTPVLVVRTKSDMSTEDSTHSWHSRVSVVNRSGIDTLLLEIVNELKEQSGHDSAVETTVARIQNNLSECEYSIRNALEIAGNAGGEEMIAAEIRVALEHIGRIVGTIYTDDILDLVFSRFCIGK